MPTLNSNILFNSDSAFSRNLGWITRDEQEKLKTVCVGLIGLGGVGGQYAEVLTRLGIQNFVIYDPDTFSIENSNRQNECRTSNYEKNKAEVIAELIQDINPNAKIEYFPQAFTERDVPDFCKKIDIYLDTLDFFEIELRMLVFAKMRELKKISMTAAPLGTGCSCIIFTPNSMSFQDYFGFHRSQDYILRSHMFILGLAPSLQQVKYLQDRTYVDLKNKKVPSMPMGVYSCASVVATNLLKIFLKRGKVLSAPWSVHYDPYLMKIKKSYLWWGYRNPIQRIKYFILKKMLKS